MKKYLRIILSMMLVLAMALTIVACKPTPTPDNGHFKKGNGYFVKEYKELDTTERLN